MISTSPPPNPPATGWTLWPVPDPDVFGDKVYSWRFMLAINLPIVLAFYALIVFSPLRAWMDVNPFVLAAGGAVQLCAFAGVLLYGHRRMHPGLRELITYGGNLAATVSLPLSTDKPLFILWVLFLLIVFFEAYGNPKALAAFAFTLAAPWASVLGNPGAAHVDEKTMLAALMTAIGGVVYLLVAYVAGWTREGALEKADRARVSGAQEERARLERTLDATLGAALSEIAVWHEVAVASEVEGARAESLAKARTRAREALTELRGLMAGIDDRPAKMAGLAGEIQRRAGNLCASAGIGFALEIGTLGRLNLSEAYHAAMVAIEAVENAVTHGKPARVTVRLSGAPLDIVVEDDGAGYDTTSAPRGRGVRNLETLADALGATLEIDSEPGRGTRVRVSRGA